MSPQATAAEQAPVVPLAPDEALLADLLVEAVAEPVSLWVHGDDASPWSYRATRLATGVDSREPAPDAPVAALEAAAEARVGAVETPATDDNLAWVAMRLGKRSKAYAVATVDRLFSGWAVRLFDAIASQGAAELSVDELSDENDSFAAQLASDLEELSFLRSMVDRLSSTRVDEGMAPVASAILPVLNSTVRARTMAFLWVDDPDNPYEATLAASDGEPCVGADSLAELLRRHGPSAESRPLVRNWCGDAEDLRGSLPNDETPPPGVCSFVLTPMQSAGRIYGWLMALNRRPQSENLLESSWQLASDEFGSGEATLMATTAAVLATHAANLDLLREKEQVMVSVVRTLVSAIESKDRYTRGHSERVALYTKRLAEEMGYEGARLETIYLSAVLHDVGKIGVRDAVLNKNGKLTEEEYAEISRHPEIGWEILCDLAQLRQVLPGVLHHHERWDGRGYPDGLAGDQIPLDGRVMAVADAFDAMTSDRSYRKGMPIEKAEEILRGGSGVQWDPECVEAYFRCREDILRIKHEYREDAHQPRRRVSGRDASAPLVHDLDGVDA